MGRNRTYQILLSDEDKKTLRTTIQNRKTCKTTICRCFILLELDENAPKQSIPRRHNLQNHSALAKAQYRILFSLIWKVVYPLS